MRQNVDSANYKIITSGYDDISTDRLFCAGFNFLIVYYYFMNSFLII